MRGSRLMMGMIMVCVRLCAWCLWRELNGAFCCSGQTLLVCSCMGLLQSLWMCSISEQLAWLWTISPTVSVLSPWTEDWVLPTAKHNSGESWRVCFDVIFTCMSSLTDLMANLCVFNHRIETLERECNVWQIKRCPYLLVSCYALNSKHFPLTPFTPLTPLRRLLLLLLCPPLLLLLSLPLLCSLCVCFRLGTNTGAALPFL